MFKQIHLENRRVDQPYLLKNYISSQLNCILSWISRETYFLLDYGFSFKQFWSHG